MNLLLVCWKQMEKFCTHAFFWCVESKWRNFVHMPSFGVWKASGEFFVHTPSFSVWKARVEVLYIWRAPLHLWMWSIPPRKKIVYLNHFFCGFRRLTLFLSVLESHFKCMKMRKSLTKCNTWIQARQNDTQILETSLMFYCTTTIIWLMLGNDTQILETSTCSLCVLRHMIFIWLMFVNKW